MQKELMTDKSRNVVIITQNRYEFSVKKIERSTVQTRKKTGGMYFRKKMCETCSEVHQALTEAI